MFIKSDTTVYFKKIQKFFSEYFCVPELQTLKFWVFQIAVRGGVGEHSPQWGGGGGIKILLRERGFTEQREPEK